MRFAMMAALAVILISPAGADTVFDFTTAYNTGGPFGNSLSFTQSGLTITATGWGLTGDGGLTFQTGELQQFQGGGLGLGVCNQDEGLNCNPPNHQVDDSGNVDAVMFKFSQPVYLTSVEIKSFVPLVEDDNASYFVGNSSITSLTGMTVLSLESLGLALTNDNNGTENFDNQRSVPIAGSGPFDTLIFAASLDGIDNFFKINEVSVQSAAPEPATLAVVGASLVAVALLRRRHRR